MSWWGDYPGLFIWVQYNHDGPYQRGAGEVRVPKEGCGDGNQDQGSKL